MSDPQSASKKSRSKKSAGSWMDELKLTPSQKTFLEKKKIRDLDTLLHTYPFRYTKITPPSAWEKGDEVLFCGIIEQVKAPNVYGPHKGVVQLDVRCEGQLIEVSVFFQGYFPRYPQGKEVMVCGLCMKENTVRAVFTSFQSLEPGTVLYPHYSLPIKTRRDMMIRIQHKALAHAGELTDRVSARLRRRYHLPSLSEALRMVHAPRSEEELAAGVRAMKYEEFLAFHVVRLLQSSRASKTPRIFDRSLIDEKIAALPYTLTADQNSALEEILHDLGEDKVMYRLLQGDVGSGKTVVCALALYACALSGRQAALLAPTELLARQHVRTLHQLGIEASLYCAAMKPSEKKALRQAMKDGSVSIVVGTHSLFQEGVEFDRLGLVAADEQHRFGVLQRRALIEKGEEADVLLLSATPIPRTAAHFLYGDIDLSAIHTKPPGRKPVITRAFYTTSMKPVLNRILEGIEKEGRQVYVVCAAIDDNEETPVRAARSIYEGMMSVLGQRVQMDLLHGKMKANEKEAVMERFSKGETQILVSTTVIEVGIDVPNATMMVIYDANRFGLSTLHQLRGRVARGQMQGECYLLSGSKSPEAKTRLRAMEESEDGFELARLDLETRGPGDLLGTRQSGLPAFILGDAGKDLRMMDICAKDAKEILEHPEDTQNHALIVWARQAMETGATLD